MRVILKANISKGKVGDIVTVARGYFRNYLAPQGKALVANKANEALVQKEKVALEKQAQTELKKAEERAAPFKKIDLSIKVKVNKDGKLFGALYATDIIDTLQTQHNLELFKQEIDLPKGPIRALGEHAVKLHFHDLVEHLLPVSVIPDESDIMPDDLDAAIRASDETIEEDAPKAESEAEENNENETEEDTAPKE